MTWFAAKKAIIECVESAQLQATGRIGAKRILHEARKAATSDKVFSLEVTAEEIVNEFQQNTHIRVRTSFDIVVKYQNTTPVDDVQDAMASDYIAIIRKLNDSNNWQRNTSTILFMDSPLPRYKKTITSDGGTNMMRIACVIVHTEDYNGVKTSQGTVDK